MGAPGWQSGGPSRDQEVLHYQWFADQGNLDAQRQLARMFAQGSQADLPRSLRYFRSAVSTVRWVAAGCDDDAGVGPPPAWCCCQLAARFDLGPPAQLGVWLAVFVTGLWLRHRDRHARPSKVDCTASNALQRSISISAAHCCIL